MNVSVVIVFLIAVTLAAVTAFPTVGVEKYGDEQGSRTLLQDPEFNLPETGVQEEEQGLRFRRVTCDLLSVSIPIGSLNHSACAAHCIAKRKGFRGGRCSNGVCHCRK